MESKKNDKEFQYQSRREIMKSLSSLSFLKPDHPLFWHGRFFVSDNNKSLQLPEAVWESSSSPRDDHEAPEWLTASEYTDTDSVMEKKILCLANLLKRSQKTVIYSGAGISVAAGIGQASRTGKVTRRKPPAWMTSTTAAKPTFTHYALSALAKHGYIHGWVQQNHDGLPQKAGYPQKMINEIHGSWFDPSNPVVLYSGNLRNREYEWMIEDAETADLALVLGTSLSGLNADQVATKTAERSLTRDAIGMIMINLQQTPHDGKASLRIFGESDLVLEALLSKLNIPIPTMEPKTFNFQENKVLVPYDENGKRVKDNDSGRLMWLDLSPSAKIKIVGHNIKGAKQPTHRHITNAVGEVIAWHNDKMAVELRIQKSCKMLLGYWWLEEAKEGKLLSIPIVNLSPRFYDAR